MRALWILLPLVLLVLGAELTVFFWNAHVFDAYSHDFGTMSQEQFQAYNDQMDRLTDIGRALAFVVLPISDVALLIQSVRVLRTGRRTTAIVSLVVALVIALFIALTLIAAQLPSGGMIG
ncbi:MAG: hypothetical protein ACJ790_04190 [Myxococcaceae bacterium]